MTTCIACNGTGKAVTAISPVTGAAVLGQCPVCFGKVQVTQGFLDSLKTAQKTMFTSALDEPVKKTKKRKQATELPAAGTGFGEVLKNVGGEVASGFIEGAKQKIAADTAVGLATLTKQLSANLGYTFPDNPLVDRGLAIGAPILIKLLTQLVSSQAPGAIPAGLLEAVNTTTSYAIQGVSKEAVEEVAAIALPFLIQVAQIGAGAVATQLASGQAKASGQQTLPAMTLSSETTS